MKTASTNTRFFAAQIDGVTLGSWYVDQAKAQAKVDAMNREWNGERTFTLHSWIADTFTAHEA